VPGSIRFHSAGGESPNSLAKAAGAASEINDKGRSGSPGPDRVSGRKRGSGLFERENSEKCFMLAARPCSAVGINRIFFETPAKTFPFLKTFSKFVASDLEQKLMIA